MAADFCNQPERIAVEARERVRGQQRKPDDFARAQEAVAYAKSSIFEREAVADGRGILRDALRRGMGETTYAAVKAEFDARQSRGEFRAGSTTRDAASRRPRPSPTSGPTSLMLCAAEISSSR